MKQTYLQIVKNHNTSAAVGALHIPITYMYCNITTIYHVVNNW